MSDKPRKWGHDELQGDLAAYLRGYSRPMLVWQDMQLGPAGSPRPDVYTIACSYTGLHAMAYEIKVSRSDFLSDVTRGKALGYRTFAGAVTFATPKGMVSKGEIPDGCGLIERGDGAWRWAKKPIIQKLDSLPLTTWLKLVIDGCKRDEGAGLIPEPRPHNTWKHYDLVREKAGAELAQLIRDRDVAAYVLQQRIEELKKQTEEVVASIRDRQQMANQRLEQEREQMYREIAQIGHSIGMTGDKIYPREVAQRLRDMTTPSIIEDLRSSVRELEWSHSRLKSKADELKATLHSLKPEEKDADAGTT